MKTCTLRSLRQIEEGSSPSYHVNAFNKITVDFEDINVKINDEDKAMILFCSLPSSYEYLVDTLMYVRQTFTIVDVKETLSSKAATKKESRDGEGLAVKGEQKIEKVAKGKNKY